MSKDKLALVYAHVNLVNGKKYFGITTNPTNERWGSVGGGYSQNEHFTNAIKKYEWDNFGHYVLFKNIPIDMAKRIENILIDEHMTHDPRFGYNKTHGGELEIPSKETCDKISASLKEYYENHSHPMCGKHLSEETRGKISDALKGREVLEETRKKMAEARSKPVEAVDPESGQRVLYFKSTMDAGRAGFDQSSVSACCIKKRKTHAGLIWRYVEEVDDDATRDVMNCLEVAAKVSKALAKKANGRRKPVEALDPETGHRVLYFKSTMDAERAGFSSGNICGCCNSKRKTHKGYIWRYVEEVNDNDGNN